MVSAGPAAARPGTANDAADARKRAERARNLAAKNKCGQAIGEYDKAIAVLHDPTLLFNRGECHRKLGNVESALEDYEQFLSDLPNAPNRDQVEQRIAELRAQQADSGDRATKVPGAPGASGAPVVTRSDPRGPPAGGPSSSSPAPPAPRLDVAPPPAAEAAPLPALAVSAEPDRPLEAGSTPLTRRPLFWVALGVVVAGAALGTYFVLGRDPTNVPRSDLGNYRF
jgi:tetratricopeptide (TPR) repeat protein